MPACLLCQTEFETEEAVLAHMEGDHAAPPGNFGFILEGIDQTIESLLPMLQEYMNRAAHSTAAIKLVEIAVANDRDIEKVLEFYKTALQSLSGAHE